MAENITLQIGETPAKKGRGRPKGSPNKARAAAAAAKADAMISGTKPALEPAPQLPPVTAPAFGANKPDCGVFLKHVNILRAKKDQIDKVKLELKGLKGQEKDLRQAAKAEGIVLGELDRALKDAETEQVDLVAREQRYLLYMGWLGKPLDFQADLDVATRQTPEQEAAAWFQRGDQAGRLAKPREAYPDGIPPERKPDFLRGWDHGQEMLLRFSPLTRDGFKSVPLPLERAHQAAEKPAFLTLKEEDFRAGIELDDANRSTIFDDATVAKFDAAENVVAIFAGMRRVLKDKADGYVDTGAENDEITEAEPVPADDAAAFA